MEYKWITFQDTKIIYLERGLAKSGFGIMNYDL